MRSVIRGSFGKSLAEVVLIVIGVLIALWVDEWRANIQEKSSIRQHLIGMVAEIDKNRSTLHRLRDQSVPEIMAALETSIRVLDQADPEIDDPDTFLRTLIASTRAPSPWFDLNSFESLRTSEGYHSPYIQGLAAEISDTYEAPNILFLQRFGSMDGYKQAVSELVPARYQSEYNEMNFYVPSRFAAPTIADEQPIEAVTAAILANRARLVRLARYKAERITAKWYSMTRIILEFQSLRDRIVAHPLMKGVELPASETAEKLEAARI